MQNPGQGRARDHSGSSKFHSEKIHPLRQGIPLDPPGIAVGRARRPGRGPGRGALRRGDPRGTAPPRGVRCARARGGADGGDGAPGMRGLVGRAPRAPGAEEPPASSHLPSPAESAEPGVRCEPYRAPRQSVKPAAGTRPPTAGSQVPSRPSGPARADRCGRDRRDRLPWTRHPGPGASGAPRLGIPRSPENALPRSIQSRSSMPSAATPMSWASSRASSVHRPAARGAGRPGTGGRVGAEGCRGEDPEVGGQGLGASDRHDDDVDPLRGDVPDPVRDVAARGRDGVGAGRPGDRVPGRVRFDRDDRGDPWTRASLMRMRPRGPGPCDEDRPRTRHLCEVLAVQGAGDRFDDGRFEGRDVVDRYEVPPGVGRCGRAGGGRRRAGSRRPFGGGRCSGAPWCRPGGRPPRRCRAPGEDRRGYRSRSRGRSTRCRSTRGTRMRRPCGCADHDALAESVDERAGGDLHEGVGPRERREDESPLRRAHGEVRRHVRQETEIADRSMWLMARPSAQTAATAHRHPVLPDPGALVLPVVTMAPPRAPYSQCNQIINQY